jgi:hypothetical protein
MSTLVTVVVVLAVVALLGLALSVRIVQQYERGCCSASAGSSESGSLA